MEASKLWNIAQVDVSLTNIPKFFEDEKELHCGVPPFPLPIAVPEKVEQSIVG